MEIAKNKFKFFLLFGLLALSCSYKSLGSLKSGGEFESYLVLVRYLGDEDQEVVDFAEEFYLVTSECIGNKTLEIEGRQFGVFPTPFDHPNGVDVCCADTLCNNDQYSVDLSNYSFLDAEEQIREVKSPRWGFGSKAEVQIFVVDGEFCICNTNYSQVSYEGFSTYAYLTRSFKAIKSLNRLEKRIWKGRLSRLQELILLH